MKIPPHIEISIPANSKVVFFSDAHLEILENEDSENKIQRVASFLDRLRNKVDVLVILGDLFDFYFEYKTVIPARYFKVLSALATLTHSGTDCYYVAGNHDFWLGELFTKTTGVKLIPDSLILKRTSEPEERILASHGDGLGEGDTGYKILKKALRNPILIRLFKLLHPDWGFSLAKITSRTSRKYTKNHQAARVKASARLAKMLLESNDSLDTVILAHTHQPDMQYFDQGIYLNPGDWCTHFSYVTWNAPGKYDLETFEQIPAGK